MQTVTPTTPTFEIDEWDAMFAATPAKSAALTLPPRQQRETVRMIGAPSPLASQVRELVLESAPAAWWWQIEALGTGGVRVTACPSETDFAWTNVGTINVARDGSVTSTYGAPKARTGQIGRASTAVSARVTHEPAPAELVAIADALRALETRRAA